MNTEEFMDIYSKSLPKLTFKAVKFDKMDYNPSEKVYYHFIGKFKCKPYDLDKVQITEEEKNRILNDCLGMTEGPNRIFRRKYTKKTENDKRRKSTWQFDFCFDFVPSNLVDFEIEGEFLVLFVRGYGTF